MLENVCQCVCVRARAQEESARNHPTPREWPDDNDRKWEPGMVPQVMARRRM